MKVRACIDALMRWAVGRVGNPGKFTGLKPREVFAPAAIIPPEFTNNNVRELVTRVRYPLDAGYEISVHHLWHAYEDAMADKKAGCAEPMWQMLGTRLKIPLKLAKYLFGTDRVDEYDATAEAAVRVAQLAHAAYGSKFGDELGGFYTLFGNAPAFGVADGQVVSKFTRGIPAKPTEAIDRLYEPSKQSIKLVAPRLLNMYHLAYVSGDEAVTYYLDTAIWASTFGIRSAGMSEIVQATKFSGPLNGVRSRARPRIERMDLTEATYQQGVYICKNADDPKTSLKDLLVPSIVSGAEYTARFANPYTKYGTGPATREKMLKVLEGMWETISQQLKG